MTISFDRGCKAVSVGLFLLALAGVATAATRPDWPAVPLPPESSGELVTDHMKNNGLDMRASKFATPKSLDEVVVFYQERWKDSNVINKLGEKTIVGHAEDGFYVTVTLQEKGGGTDGTIGTLLMPKEKVDYVMGEGFDKPSGTEVFNDIRYYDAPGETRTLGMTNDLSPFQNYEYYRQRLYAKGWKLQEGRKCVMPSRACAALFERKGGKIAMTLNKDPGTGTQILVTID